MSSAKENRFGRYKTKTVYKKKRNLEITLKVLLHHNHGDDNNSTAIVNKSHHLQSI